MGIIVNKQASEIKRDIHALNAEIRTLINQINFGQKTGKVENGLYAKKNYLKLLKKELIEKEQPTAGETKLC